MNRKLARLLFPAIRWDTESGFDAARDPIERALELGVGGFIIFGGIADQVAALTADLQRRSAHPLLIAADLERGAGQQFEGATQLPPLAAFGYLDDEQLTERAGQLTALEARALGINWIYAPVADIDIEPRNPIVGTRSFGQGADLVSRHVAAWVEGCHRGQALACAKHFPGHGRTTTDSHAELPAVETDAGALRSDLAPFEAALEREVDSVMTAHVRYPAYDVDGTAATLSQRIVSDLLRQRLQFDGLVITDALMMEGVIEAGAGEARAGVLAVKAGCDCLLYPSALEPVLEALEAALDNELPRQRVEDALHRINAAATRVPAPVTNSWGRDQDRTWAVETGQRAVHWVRGQMHGRNSLDLYIVDDDLGGPFAPPARHYFVEQLRRHGIDVTLLDAPAPHCALAVFCDVRAWKKRPGLSVESAARASAAVEAGADLAILFSHPRVAGQVEAPNVLCAWGGEEVMQRAAANRFAGLPR